MKGLFVSRYPEFIKPIIGKLAELGVEGELVDSFSSSDCPPVDFIWVDFATEEAVAVQTFLTPAKKILRIHSYEAYCEILPLIVPRAWHKIIVVNNRMGLKVQRNWSEYADNMVTISNYVDTDKYNFTLPKEANNKIAYAGHFSRTKGIPEILMIAKMYPDYEFHLAGSHQEPDLEEYMKVNLPGNVRVYEWQGDLPTFFSDKTYYINASIRESFCVSMVQAMCCGLKPITRNWLGAALLYPQNCIWDNPTQIGEMLEKVNKPSFYRSWAINHLGLKTVIDAITGILAEESAEAPYPTLTIGIVQTRRKYMNTLLNSLRNQNYPLAVDIYDNLTKEKSIGECFNALADRCQTEWIMYVGDDDALAEDYVLSVMDVARNRDKMYNNVISVLSGAMLIGDDGKRILSEACPTGAWRADAVRKYRFDETLVRQVDTDFLRRVADNPEQKVIIRAPWICGYYYRQHDKNISGNKFTEGANTSQTPPKE